MALTLKRTVSAALIVPLVACTALRPVTTPQQFIATAHPDRVWITQADNSTLLLEAPRLLGDTLVGFVGGRYQELLLPQVRRVDVRQSAPMRTAFVVAGVIGIGALLISVLASTGPQGYQPTPEGVVVRP